MPRVGAARRAAPNFRRERAASHKPNPHAKTRSRKEGKMAVSAVLKNRGSHEGTEPRRKPIVVMAVTCRFGAHDNSPRIEKNGRGGSPSGPKPQARTRRCSRNQFLARWPMFRFPASDFRFQNFFCSPRKCPTGGFRMPAEMITRFLKTFAIFERFARQSIHSKVM